MNTPTHRSGSWQSLRRHAGAALLTGLLAAAALPTLAQSPSSAAAAPTAQAGQTTQVHPRDMTAEQRQQWRAQRQQQRQQQHWAGLKDQLQLQANQQTAWEQFTQSMQQPTTHARLDQQALDKLSTPERIDRMRALRQQHAAEADRRGEATKAFYAQLTPAQQKTFDAQRSGHGRHMGKHMGHGMSHGMDKHGGWGGHGGKHGQHQLPNAS